jgi:hypothetical protein
MQTLMNTSSCFRSILHLNCHPPRPQSLLESPHPTLQLHALLDSILDEDDDPEASQQPVHGGDGSTESNQSFVHSETPPSTYLSLPVPSVSPPPLASPLSTPPLAPAPLLVRPQCIRRPRSEWLPDQWAIQQHYKQIREPTPAIPSSDEDDSNSDDPIDLIHAHSGPVKTGPELTGVHLTKSGPVRVSVHVSLSQKMSAFQMKSEFLRVESELI